MLKHRFVQFIKRLSLVFLLIIQTSTFSSNSRLPMEHTNQWATCAPNNEQTIIYNENSMLHLKPAEKSCTMIVVGNRTHLIIHSDNSHLLSVPMTVENGWLYLGGEKSLNLYYSGIYKITIQGKLQEVTLQFPIPNSKVIYENGTNQDYRRLRSAEQLFVPLEFQSHTVTLLSNDLT